MNGTTLTHALCIYLLLQHVGVEWTLRKVNNHTPPPPPPPPTVQQLHLQLIQALGWCWPFRFVDREEPIQGQQSCSLLYSSHAFSWKKHSSDVISRRPAPGDSGRCGLSCRQRKQQQLRSNVWTLLFHITPLSALMSEENKKERKMFCDVFASCLL